MALRSLGRMMPAAPLMGPVHKLSPAGGSRLLATDLPSVEEGQIVSSREQMVAAHRAKMDLMRAQCEQTSREIDRAMEACDESYRRDAEEFEMLLKQHQTIRKTCSVIRLLCVPAALLTYLYSR